MNVSCHKMLDLHEKVAALNVLHYILSHNYDYRSTLLVIFSKATINMPKNFGYEI